MENKIIPPGEQITVKNGEILRNSNGTFGKNNKGGPGRPRKEDSIDTWLLVEAQKAHGKLPDGTVITKAEMIAKVLVEKAINGNLKAIQLVCERVDGKPMQKIQFVAPEDAPGTVLSTEDEERLLRLFGRNPEVNESNNK